MRDKQTVIYTFVLPICMYPILFWVLVQGALVVQGKREQTAVRVGVAAEDPGRMTSELMDALTARDAERDSEAEDDFSAARIDIVDLERNDEIKGEAAARAWLAEEADGDEPLDAVLFLTGRTDGDENTEAVAKLFYDSTKSRSGIARRRLQRRIPQLASTLREAAAAARDLAPEALDPIAVESHDVSTSEGPGALMLASILPMLLVIMTVLGAFFPAVDLTAGEKERRTAETTLLLPVQRAAVLQGKILAVCTTAVIATTLNLIAIGLAADHLFGMLAQSTDVDIVLPVRSLIAIAPLALLFVFFVSAVLVGFAGLASTFKEGQALLGPVQMIFIFPAMAGAIPGLELTMKVAWIPVVNVVLAFRALLLGQAISLEYAMTAISLLFWAGLAIFVALRLLSREAVSLAPKTIPFSKLFSTFRSEGGTR